jgi:hypothetical protein
MEVLERFYDLFGKTARMDDSRIEDSLTPVKQLPAAATCHITPEKPGSKKSKRAAAISARAVLQTIAVSTSDCDSVEDKHQLTADEGTDEGDGTPRPSIKGEQLRCKPVFDAEKNEMCDNGCKDVQPKRKRTSARHVQVSSSRTSPASFKECLSYMCTAVES